MADRSEQHGQSMLIGPGIPEEDGLCLADLPEPGEVPPQVEGRRLLLRLVIAFFLSLVLAAVCFVVLPSMGVDIPAWIPLLAMLVIAIAALMTASAEGQLPPMGSNPGTDPAGCDAPGRHDGRPVGCCPGPRPPRFLRAPPKR